MKVGITGGSGLIGTHLAQKLVEQGHSVVVWTRSPDKVKPSSGIQVAQWPIETQSPIDNSSSESNHGGQPDVDEIDAIVNLAGETINQRWTDKAKERILNSRVETTKRLVQYLQAGILQPKVLLSASAVGYYGFSMDKEFTEQSSPAHDFLAQVCQAWEKEADAVSKLGVRLVKMRFGVVLDPGEGALLRMILPYRLFVGGRIGSGKQWVPWIHIEDLVRMIVFALENERLEGPLNGTAPRPVMMNEFGQTIGKVLHRPHWLPVPSVALETLLGQMSSLILKGQYVLPEKALQSDYTFRYPELERALQDLLQGNDHHKQVLK